MAVAPHQERFRNRVIRVWGVGSSNSMHHSESTLITPAINRLYKIPKWIIAIAGDQNSDSVSSYNPFGVNRMTFTNWVQLLCARKDWKIQTHAHERPSSRGRTIGDDGGRVCDGWATVAKRMWGRYGRFLKVSPSTGKLSWTEFTTHSETPSPLLTSSKVNTE